MTASKLYTLLAPIIFPPECLGEVRRHEISQTPSSSF
jgi:hypothetical protein